MKAGASSERPRDCRATCRRAPRRRAGRRRCQTRALCVGRSSQPFPPPSSCFTTNMGGGARYPYPKEVWSPAGGWWTRPSNWKTNTAIAFAGILAVAYGVFTVSAEKEKRTIQPIRPIPSMRWAKEYREQKEAS
ncbi:hypothetical protein OH77DRAFT_1289470 [Trametes cingulata]|nr:hypothetical protein OH77DRAFT_1289470 [Trametes cingulata]